MGVDATVFWKRVKGEVGEICRSAMIWKTGWKPILREVHAVDLGVSFQIHLGLERWEICRFAMIWKTGW